MRGLQINISTIWVCSRLQTQSRTECDWIDLLGYGTFPEMWVIRYLEEYVDSSTDQYIQSPKIQMV